MWLRGPGLDDRRIRRPSPWRSRTRRSRQAPRGGFLVPWFAPRTTTIADVTYFMAHEWLLHLVGRDQECLHRRRPGLLSSPPKHVAIRGVRFGRSGGRVRGESPDDAAALARRCPPWRLSRRTWPRADSSSALKLFAREVTSRSYSRRVTSPNALWVLRKVLSFARANGLFAPGFDPTEGLDAPAPNRRQVVLDVRPAKLVLLLCPSALESPRTSTPPIRWCSGCKRIMGLRISEAFGLLVGRPG